MTEFQMPHSAHDGVHVSFLLDRSGSMGRIVDDVIGGFNQFHREQQRQPGACRMTLVQFDSQAPFEILTDAISVHEVPPLDPLRYQPRGGTPLYDALGHLLELADRHARGRDEDTVVVVFTDGQENASVSWSREAVFERIESLKEKGWTFVFMGANQDSYAASGRLRFTAGSTSNWHLRDSRTAFSSMSRSMASFRSKQRTEREIQKGDFFEGLKEAESGSLPSPERQKTKTTNGADDA
jgi:uncharacterized protein YegL